MSVIRILLDQLSKALRRANESVPCTSNSPPSPSCPQSCSQSEEQRDSTICHNPEQISDWHAHEIHEYHALCSGKECSWIIPLAGNAFLTKTNGIPLCNSNLITPSGLVNWKDEWIKVSLYFNCVLRGHYLLALRLRVPGGHSSRVRISIMSCTNTASQQQQCQIPVVSDISIGGQEMFQLVPCGKFYVSQQGYVKVDLCGLQRSGPVFADITHAVLIPDNDSSRKKRSVTSDAPDTPIEKTLMKFVSDPDDFYFGRRGPSVHLNYMVPPGVDGDRNIEYFYNEVWVPMGQDVIGSYFCACGFSGGYFGIQVNSSTERRILFSIWSAYSTDNPNDIPSDYQVSLLRKGDKVHIGEFGNEGSGGQSYLRYPWKSEKLYKFLVQARPMDENNTIYSAWFMDEYAESEWILIASFRKPKVSTWLKGMYSFSENFIPEMGHVERSCIFKNQWAWDVGQCEWIEITTASFSADATASKGTRADVAGGVTHSHDGSGTAFYLRNCGFFSDNAQPGIRLCRQGSNGKPGVDFSKL